MQPQRAAVVVSFAHRKRRLTQRKPLVKKPSQIVANTLQVSQRRSLGALRITPSYGRFAGLDRRVRLAQERNRLSTPEQKRINDADKKALAHGRFPEASGLGWIVRRRVGVVAT